MDIIPIIPAPQQGITPEAVELPPGGDATGFNLLLNQELAAGEQSAKHANKNDSGGHFFKDETGHSRNEVANQDNAPLSSIQTPNQQVDLEFDIGAIADGQEMRDTQRTKGQPSALYENEPAPLSSDQGAASKITDATITSQSSNIISSEALSPISQEPLRTPYGQENLLRDFINLSTLLSHHLQPLTGQAVQTPGNGGEHVTNSPTTTLHLHSAAAAFSVQSRDAIHTISLQQASIVSEGTLTSPFGSISGSAVRANYTFTPAGATLTQTPTLASSNQETPGDAPHQISTKSTGMHDGSVLVKSPHTLPLPGHPVPHNNASIMFEQLQKLVNLNNDKVTMHVSTGEPAMTERTIGSLTSPPRVKIVEPPVTATTQATNGNPAVMTKATESVANLSPQASSMLNRNGSIETVQEQLTSSRTTVPELNTEQDKSSSFQQNPNSSQGNSVPQQQTAATTAGTPPTASEQPPGSSTFNSQFQEVSANNSGDSVKPASSPTAPMSFVRDQEIINQIVDRFTLQSHLQTSRLSIQLNPAELGELKIELIVKGDALKANIYAQTHQASEIIDRNLPRLREILQSQGMSVDELIVSFNSDTIDNFSSQHGQLFQDQNTQLENRRDSQPSARFDNTIEELLLSETENQSGVNLTI